MRYEVGLINPTTNEQQSVVVELSHAQAEAAQASPDWMEYVLAQTPRPPRGFMFLGCAVRRLCDA